MAIVEALRKEAAQAKTSAGVWVTVMRVLMDDNVFRVCFWDHCGYQVDYNGAKGFLVCDSEVMSQAPAVQDTH